MAFDFDPTTYIRSPRGDVPTMLALARALLTAAPEKPTRGVAKATRRLRVAAARLERLWATRRQPLDDVDRRAADLRIDTAWSSFKVRLDGFAALDGVAPEAARATALRDAFFPEGLAFTKLLYPAEWAESEQRLRRIDEEKLAGELEELIGRSILIELRRAHSEYGKALGITRVVERPPSDALTEPLRDIVRTIGDYGLQISAMIDPDDESSLAIARAALRPIDVARSATASRSDRGAAADDREPSTDPVDTPADEPVAAPAPAPAPADGAAPQQ